MPCYTALFYSLLLPPKSEQRHNSCTRKYYFITHLCISQEVEGRHYWGCENINTVLLYSHYNSQTSMGLMCIQITSHRCPTAWYHEDLATKWTPQTAMFLEQLFLKKKNLLKPHCWSASSYCGPLLLLRDWLLVCKKSAKITFMWMPGCRFFLHCIVTR